MLRGIKIRLYPNKTQERALNKVLGCYRFVYNQMLSRKQNAYKADKTNLSVTELSKWFHGTLLKDEQYAWLKEQNTKVMKQAIRQMDGAYQNFFKQHNGFPKFKTKKDRQSALFPYEAISKKNTFETKHISLTTSLKSIKFRCSDLYLSRLQKYNKNIRSATLSKTKSGKFFLSILIKMEDTEFKKFGHTNKQVTTDRVMPNKEQLDEMNKTAAAIQAKQTQEKKAEMELARAKAEKNKAIADKAYMNELALSPQQFIQLRAWDVIANKQGANIDVLVGSGETPMWNIKQK